MKAVTKIFFFDDDGDKFFGEGPARLMHAVEEKGSLRMAAMSMNMAYTKALKLIRQTEKALGTDVLIRTTGGKGGGGSKLTEEGKEWLEKYEAYRDACILENSRIFRDMFCRKNGCVIMASGEGRRFGGNKLMADFLGKPLIERILDATEGLFYRRIVVTRHETVAGVCKARGVEVVRHSLPLRSDTVRIGIEAVGDVDSCMFCPGDQPLLSRETVERLIRHSEEDTGNIWRTCCGEAPGSPVIFPKWAFDELRALPEGKGGSWLTRKYPDRVRMMEVADHIEMMDADTPEALEYLRRLAGNVL